MRPNHPLLCACLALPVFGASQIKSINEVEKLEWEQDPPAAWRPFRSTPALVISHGIYTSFQVNVNSQGNNIVGDAANEPSIAVSPIDPNRMAVGWRQFNSVTSNFRQAGWSFTTNGGSSWTFPGVLENNVFRSDPVLDVDANGNFYYLSLLNTFFDDIWGSPNQGGSWTRLGPATGGDKQWMIIDRTNSPGRGHIYQIWSTAGNNYNGRQFSRSTNGGSVWMNPINIPLQPIWGVLDIAPNGDLYIGGSNGDSNFYFVRSTNAKNPAVTPTFDMSRTISLGGAVGFGQPINPAGLSGQAYIATDKTSTPYGGFIYLLSSVEVNATNPLDVRFARSTDGGNTWSASKRINDDPSNTSRYHWMAAMGIAPNGRIEVVWNDTRASANNQFSALYYSCSFDGGDTWLPNTQVSPTFNHTLGYPNQNKMGDYLGLVSDNGGARVAYCATFNGEEDVYYLRIPSPEAVSPWSAAGVLGSVVSGGPSSVAYTDGLSLLVKTGFLLGQDRAAVVEFRGTTSILSPSKLRLKVEANGSPGSTQRVQMFNYQSQQFETVDTRPSTASDSTVLVDTTGDRSRFVNQGSGEMRARIRYEAGAIVRGTPSGRLDHVQWIVLQ